ncbi:MAG: type II toxin-antitoxin system RelE/ParE family toxin [Candidatus Methanoperedens sp.]|nr:type II toxin-antitoxin system RelE/ParE family toxin [Candidatus Methanoperedens sp.]CAG0968595.1 hypothetical protein METP1_01105 [Methanosarcinales archaeon]
MFNVVLTKKAEKSFLHLPEEVQNSCGDIFDELQFSFAPIKHDIIKMKGHNNIYRIRVGDWRIIYKVDKKIKQVIVFDILPRKIAYRNF